MTHKLKVGDVISYEPLPKWTEAQVMWGSVGVVRELLEWEDDYGYTVRVNWVHAVEGPQWHGMRISEDNCRKIGEVPDGEAEAG